jgi:hypothetical protein
MCDFEELEYEDFEMMLAAISKISRAQREESPLQAPTPQLVIARKRK